MGGIRIKTNKQNQKNPQTNKKPTNNNNKKKKRKRNKEKKPKHVGRKGKEKRESQMASITQAAEGHITGLTSQTSAVQKTCRSLFNNSV